MTIKFSCLLLTIFISFSAKSQQFAFKFSDKEYNMYNSFANAVPAKNGKIVLQLRNEGFAWIPTTTKIEASLLLVNDKIETVKQAEIIFQAKNRFIEVKGLFQAAGKTILVYAFKNEKKDKEYTVAAIKIDENTLAAAGETELGRFETQSGGDLPDYKFIYGLDSSKYLLFVEPVQRSKELKKIQYSVFSSGLQKDFENNIELPYESKFISIQSILPDNNGNVFVEYRNYEKEVTPELIADEDSKTPVYETVLAQFARNSAQAHEIKFSMNDNPLHSSRIAFNPLSGKLNIAGTYRNSKKGRVKGFFYCDYDANAKSISNFTMKEVPTDLLSLFDKDEVGSKSSKNPGISGNFKAQRLSARSNGTVDYALEYNSTTEGMSNVGGKAYSFSQKFSKDILNVNIDKKGNMIFTRIPKNQLAGDRAFLSSFSFYNGKNLFFIYADNKKNEGRDINKAPEQIDEPYKQSVLMAARVDEKGGLERTIIFNHDDDDFVAMPLSIKAISSSLFFIVRKKVGSFIAIEHTKIGTMQVK